MGGCLHIFFSLRWLWKSIARKGKFDFGWTKRNPNEFDAGILYLKSRFSLLFIIDQKTGVFPQISKFTGDFLSTNNSNPKPNFFPNIENVVFFFPKKFIRNLHDAENVAY